jgi:uncharacterized protein (TIGR02594 family)
MMQRRQLFIGGFAAVFMPGKAAWGQPQADEATGYGDFESVDVPQLGPLGADEATASQALRGIGHPHPDRLLLASPHKKRPLDVMLYLENLPEQNSDREPYNAGWRERWNPVIVRFFSETKTKPSGDTTSWCAASLNWALARSGARNTRSASSGSFRDAWGRTDTPQAGDIVVFRRTNVAEARAGRGHVGLFLAQTEDAVLVLGGNQTSDYGHHAVSRKWIRKRNGVLTLDSFHSVSEFKDICRCIVPKGT